MAAEQAQRVGLPGWFTGAGLSQGQHCACTRVAHAAVVVHYHQPGGGDSPFLFDLLFDRSLARYLWELLIASAAHADDLAKTFARSE